MLSTAFDAACEIGILPRNFYELDLFELNAMLHGFQVRKQKETRELAQLLFVQAVQVGNVFNGKVNKVTPEKVLPDLFKEIEKPALTEAEKAEQEIEKWRKFFMST